MVEDSATVVTESTNDEISVVSGHLAGGVIEQAIENLSLSAGSVEEVSGNLASAAIDQAIGNLSLGARSVEKVEETEEKPSRGHVDIRSWLNSMQGGDDGWGNQFGGAFDEVGLEDTSDFADLDEDIMADLTAQLKGAGASTGTVDSVMSAILSLRAG